MRTAFGWTYLIGIVGAVNDRSIRNWPIQSAGADILRIACILAVRHGIKLLAPVHDAILIEAPVDRIEADVALMKEIMRRAPRIRTERDGRGNARTAHRGKHRPVSSALFRQARRCNLGPCHRPTDQAETAGEAEGLNGGAKRYVRESAALVDRAGDPRNEVTASLCLRLAATSGMEGRKTTFPLPNASLTKQGADRRAKRRALANLEFAGLITVERKGGKTPVVTLLCL